MFIQILLVSLLYAKVIGYECGIVYNQLKPKTSIINKETLEGDWPWVVSIFHNGEKICTGSIISPKFVLTSAHCYNEQMLNKKKRRHSFSIHAGTIHAKEGEVVRVKKIRTFDEAILKVARNDIAIFELERSLIFNHNVSSICLPKLFHEFPGKLAFVAGFGNKLFERIHTFFHEEYSNHLSHVIIPFQEFDYCDPANKEWNYNSSNYICAGDRVIDVAKGDSGSPLMIKNPVFQQGSYKSRWIAVGVVVGGNYINEKERDFLLWSHSFFTRISYYCDWIEDVTDEDAKCIEVLGHKLQTAKSTFTTSTKPTISAVTEVVQYSGGCYDQDMTSTGYKSCPTSKDDNRCAKKNGPIHKSVVRYYCPESCGVCTENGFPRPYPPNSTCSDAVKSIIFCLHYKDQGFCDPQNPEYGLARTNCAYTCGLC